MSDNLYIQEQCVEVGEEKRIMFYDSEVFLSRFTSVSEVFRYYQKERGRCVSKVYVGEKKPKQIGWVFEKRAKYNDCDDTFLQETWITIHTAPARKVIEYSPMYIGEG